MVKAGADVISFFVHLPDHVMSGLAHSLNPFSHAEGGVHLPGHATIQSAVHPRGLVQWAEPETGGEAFIPLHQSKRQRSLGIWRQTGMLLGAFAGGGFYGVGSGKDEVHNVEPQILAVERIAGAFGLKMTSGHRNEPGSFHNTGEAGDYSNGNKTQQELAFAMYMAKNYRSSIAELIHDDPNFVYNIKDGRFVGPFGQFYTMGQAGYHGDHVHVAIRHAMPFGGVGATGIATGFGRPASFGTTRGNKANEMPTGLQLLGRGLSFFGGLLSGSPSSGIGSATGKGGPTGWGGEVDDSTAEDAVSAIVAEGRRRGYSDAEISWIVADAIGESGLDPQVTNLSGHHGLFQQDSSYPARGTMSGQIQGFYDRLEAQTSSAHSPVFWSTGTIGQRIVGVEMGGYGPNWIQRFMGQAQSRMAGIRRGRAWVATCRWTAVSAACRAWVATCRWTAVSASSRIRKIRWTTSTKRFGISRIRLTS